MSENNKLQSALKSPRTRKYGLRLIMAVLLLGVLGFFVLPPIVKHVAVSKMSELLHRPVAIESISINPYALSLTLEGLEIKEREGAPPSSDSTASMSMCRPRRCSAGGR